MHLQLASLLQRVGHAGHADQRPVGLQLALRQRGEFLLAADQAPRPRRVAANGSTLFQLLPILLRHPLPRSRAAFGLRCIRVRPTGQAINAVAGATGAHHQVHVALCQHLVGDGVVVVARCVLRRERCRRGVRERHRGHHTGRHAQALGAQRIELDRIAIVVVVDGVVVGLDARGQRGARGRTVGRHRRQALPAS
ncbi:hypothetical protein G6F23_013680 [Rhizopus arrhizus]|nr:hypothetical protein G6F23_013680 [Rhizopus arrhizus]